MNQVKIEANEYYEDSKLVTINGGGHGYSSKHDQIALAAVKKFLQKN